MISQEGIDSSPAFCGTPEILVDDLHGNSERLKAFRSVLLVELNEIGKFDPASATFSRPEVQEGDVPMEVRKRRGLVQRILQPKSRCGLPSALRENNCADCRLLSEQVCTAEQSDAGKHGGVLSEVPHSLISFAVSNRWISSSYVALATNPACAAAILPALSIMNVEGSASTPP